MNLIYICVFYQKSYINLLKLLITSISTKSNINKENTDILIITSTDFKLVIEKELQNFNLPLLYYILEANSIFEAGCARLNIFKYDCIDKYENILYLDTDILLNSDINTLFNLELSSEKIYTVKEGNIGHVYWGGQFFDFRKYDRNLSAFTSGVLLFKNSICIKKLFNDIQEHITEYIYNKNVIPDCLDQPFIVYNAISQGKYDNQILNYYVDNSPVNISVEKIIYHFAGGPGAYDSKISKMLAFWYKMNPIPKVLFQTNKKPLC